ncbi:hypothetical protein DAA51_24695 [Bradyrhizobium sp. WBAH10]|nr:hypothetical protein [Bradyrhizobium sp. WBAH42]QCJ76635.1 hypothetical protein DAA51_24695 [Bradyrhizobium sp. WBAH10]QCJ91277.1 hypothetical protein DAA57_24285 [Bradyrhizobium yuanmingense]
MSAVAFDSLMSSSSLDVRYRAPRGFWFSSKPRRIKTFDRDFAASIAFAGGAFVAAAALDLAGRTAAASSSYKLRLM